MKLFNKDTEIDMMEECHIHAANVLSDKYWFVNYMCYYFSDKNKTKYIDSNYMDRVDRSTLWPSVNGIYGFFILGSGLYVNTHKDVWRPIFVCNEQVDDYIKSMEVCYKRMFEPHQDIVDIYGLEACIWCFENSDDETRIMGPEYFVLKKLIDMAQEFKYEVKCVTGINDDEVEIGNDYFKPGFYVQLEHGWRFLCVSGSDLIDYCKFFRGE